MNIITVEQTKEFSMKAHGAQTRRGNAVPYFLHAERVAEAARMIAKVVDMDKDSVDDIVRISLLHDVVEDTPVTLEDLTEYGFSEIVVQAVGLLTKPKYLTHRMHVSNIIKSGDILAIIVKAADCKDNSHFSEEDVKWYNERGVKWTKEQAKYLDSNARLLRHIIPILNKNGYYDKRVSML